MNNLEIFALVSALIATLAWGFYWYLSKSSIHKH